MKTHYRKNSFLPLTAALALLVNSATAVTYTWTGVTSTTWSVATNWTGGIPAVANTSDVIIGGIANVGNMLAGGQSYTVKSLTFDGTNDANTALTLQVSGNNGSGSRALTFSSDSGNATLTVAADSTGDKTFNRGGTGVSNILLTSSLDIVHNGSGNLTFGSQINTTGAGGINKSGTGTLLLAGSNTYTGATTISAGTLSLGSGGTAGSLTATSAITNNSNLTINRSNAFSQATDLGAGIAITGTGSFTQAGTGTTTLTAANTYTGITTLSAGILNLGVAESVGVSGPLGNSASANPGSIVFGGGTLQYSASNTYDYSGRFSTAASQAYRVDTNGQNVTWATNLTGSGVTLTKTTGGGNLTLTGNNTYTGLTTVSGGTLFLGHPTDTLSSSSAITVDGATAVLAIAGNSDTVGVVSLKNGGSITGTGGTLTGASYAVESGSVSATLGGAGIALTKSTAGTVTLSGTSTYTGTTTLSAGILNLGVAESVGVSGPLGNSAAVNPGSIVFGGGTLQYSAANTHDYSGRFSTAASQSYNINTNGQSVTWAANLTSSGGILSNSGAGTLTLTGNNTFSGGMFVGGGGKVIAGHNNALGTATVTIDNNGSALELADGITLNNAISINNQANAKSIQIVSGTSAITGNITINETTYGNAEINAFGGILTLSGIISGNAFEKNGAGTVILTGANTYTGGTLITGGILNFANKAAKSATGTVTAGAGGSVGLGVKAADAAYYSATDVGDLFNTNTLTGFSLNAASGVAIDTTNAGADFDQTVALTAGRALTKLGTGTLILSGTNTYTGNTTVSAGTLALADNAQLSFVLGATSGSNNSLSGAGTVTLEGDFVIVTTAADALASGTWTIENVSTLTGAYGSNFTVSGFTDAGSDKWTKVNGSKTYTFDETTGILTLAETPVAGYSAWATLNGAGVNFNEDHDNDGVDNGTEYFIGGTAGNTTGFTPLPGVTNTLGVLSVTYTKAATYTGVYGTDYVVETSSTLADPWTPQLADPTPDFTVTFPSANEVRYTFPAGTKQFARLKVIQTP